MTYLRSLFLNFLIVFFVDRVVPGVVINSFENVPNIGADILFSVILGFLNASVYPFLSVLELSATPIKMAVMTFVITFAGFTVISVIPFGVQVVSPAGFIVGGLIVWVIAFFSNHLEWKHANTKT